MRSGGFCAHAVISRAALCGFKKMNSTRTVQMLCKLSWLISSPKLYKSRIHLYLFILMSGSLWCNGSLTMNTTAALHQFSIVCHCKLFHIPTLLQTNQSVCAHYFPPLITSEICWIPRIYNNILAVMRRLSHLYFAWRMPASASFDGAEVNLEMQNKERFSK